MKQLLTALLCLGSLSSIGCAKKEPKPMRTEPWLAHPPASASASNAPELPEARYVLGERSLIRFEIPVKHGLLSGTLSRVSGELTIALSDLTHTRGVVRAELGSLQIHADHGAAGSDEALLERAHAALELPSDPSAASALTSFELSAIEDALPPAIEPPTERAASPTPFIRRAQLTAVGNLLLHGFRVIRRAPLAAEFSFNGDERVPHSILIRSRSPFVVSLETHAIAALAPEKQGRDKAPNALPARVRDARVSIELYYIKSE